MSCAYEELTSPCIPERKPGSLAQV